MKKYIYLSIIIFALILSGLFANRPAFGETLSQLPGMLYNSVSNFVYPRNSTAGIQIPSLSATTSQTTVHADASGNFYLGTGGGSGGSASASAPSLSLQYNDGTGALLGSANLLFTGGNAIFLNGTINATTSKFTNSSSTNLSVSGNTYIGPTNTFLAADSNGKIIATTTPSIGAVTSVSGSGSILSSGGTTPTIQLQSLTANDILFGQGTNIIGTSSSFTYNGTNLIVQGGGLIATSTSVTNASSTNETTTNFYLTGATTGCATFTGQILSSTGVACGSGGGGNSAWTIGNGLIYNATSTDSVLMGTTTPTTAQVFIQGSGTKNPLTVATSTGNILFQITSIGNVNIATATASSLALYDANKNLSSYLGASNCASGQAVIGLSISGATTCSVNGLQTALTNPVTGTGTNGNVVRWTSSSAVSAGILLDNGTVAGVTATSSTVAFDIQPAGSLDPIQVGTSTNNNLFIIKASGNVGIGTTTPAGSLVIQGYSGDTNNLLTISSSTGATLFSVVPSSTANLSVGTSTTPTNLYIDGTNATVRIGEPTTGNVGCLEIYDSVNTTTLEYLYTANNVVTATTTKPNFCQ